MSNDRTQEFDEHRSFEERVFARFHSIDGRLGVLEIRITKLDERQSEINRSGKQVLAIALEMKADLAEMRASLPV